MAEASSKTKRKVYSFQSQLRKGKKSEKEFLEHFGLEDKVTRISGRDGDFQVNWSGQIVELKTDYYKDSPNLFMERWSVWKQDGSGKPGGAYQSLEHGTDILAYWVRQPDELFLFDVEKLVKDLDSVSRKLILVNNRGYRSGGYKVTKEEARKFSSYLGSDLTQLTRFFE